MQKLCHYTRSLLVHMLHIASPPALFKSQYLFALSMKPQKMQFWLEIRVTQHTVTLHILISLFVLQKLPFISTIE